MRTAIFAIFALTLTATSASAAGLKMFCGGTNNDGSPVRFVEDTFNNGRLNYEVMARSSLNEMPPYPYIPVSSYVVTNSSITPEVIEISGTDDRVTTGISGSVQLKAHMYQIRDGRIFYKGKASVRPTVSTVRPVLPEVIDIVCELRN